MNKGFLSNILKQPRLKSLFHHSFKNSRKSLTSLKPEQAQNNYDNTFSFTFKKKYISGFEPVYVEDCNFFSNEVVMSTTNDENT